MCVPGLSSNATGFDRLAADLVAEGRQVVALDLRGRGASDRTPPGTYGWPAHAADVAGVASALGLQRFDVVGHSMGAYVAMELAAAQPDRVRRLVLIDGAGAPEPEALEIIGKGLERLDRWHDSEDAYVEAVRAGGVVSPWSELWERFFRYELEHRADGKVRSLTSLAAVLEDVEWGRSHRQDALWPRLSCPTLLVTAAVPLGDGRGFVVAPADKARFLEVVPGSAVTTVDANHFGILTAPATSEAIRAFLRTGTT
ncbi:MAG TPA: alpha/beta hydrolase [Microbacterium sp.]|nr:alpha/beta hydrolase [Microbacterium sp.]